MNETDRQYYFMEKASGHVAKLGEELGRKPTCCVTTFGCQMNARDSEKLVGILEKVGYEIIEDENADFVIYNTCTVRDNANQRVYGRLGVLNGYKRKNPHMKIALCGCMMQEPSVIEKIKNSYRFVDLILGRSDLICLTVQGSLLVCLLRPLTGYDVVCHTVLHQVHGDHGKLLARTTL